MDVWPLQSSSVLGWMKIDRPPKTSKIGHRWRDWFADIYISTVPINMSLATKKGAFSALWGSSSSYFWPLLLRYVGWDDTAYLLYKWWCLALPAARPWHFFPHNPTHMPSCNSQPHDISSIMISRYNVSRAIIVEELIITATVLFKRQHCLRHWGGWGLYQQKLS